MGSRTQSWRSSREYREWKKACKTRDGNKCVLTGLTSRLEVHHIRHSSYFKDLRFDVDNGVTINKYVHLIFHIFVMRGYRKKCDHKDWKRFVYLFKYIIKLKNLMELNK